MLPDFKTPYKAKAMDAVRAAWNTESRRTGHAWPGGS